MGLELKLSFDEKICRFFFDEIFYLWVLLSLSIILSIEVLKLVKK